MSIDINILNSQVGSILKNANLDQLVSKATEAASQLNLQTGTSLARVGDVQSGITALTSAVDQVDQVANAADSIVEITGAVPGLETDLIGDVSAAASDLGSITGGTAANGSLNFIISSGSPEAIAKSLGEVTGKTADELQDVLKSVAPNGSEDAVANLEKALTEGLGAASGFGDALNSFKSSFDSLLDNVGGGILTDMIRKIDKTADDILDKVLSGIDLDALDLLGNVVLSKQALVDLIAAGNKDDAIALIIANDPSADPAIVEEQVNQVELNPANTIVDQQAAAVGTRTSSCYVIGSNNATWQGESTPITTGQFTSVDSPEELIAELRACSRPITEVIAHWTASYTNQDWGSEKVHELHQQRGFSGIGYHYVIKRDGTLQRGRPLERRGAHSKAYGHNNYSIGVSMAGGYNCPSNTPSPNRYISADSLTTQSLATFEWFMRCFYDVFPGGQTYGHNDTSDLGKVDPGFDCQEYVRIKFGKTNVITDGRAGPLSPAELAARR